MSFDLHPSSKYVGIPKLDLGRSMAGCDCYGLVYLVQWREFRREVPSYIENYVSCGERREVSALIGRESESPLWKRVEVPLWGDVINFSRPGIGHLGIFVDRHFMLHMEGSGPSCLARLDEQPWLKRNAGVYRWNA
jgi:probable lipoprotein NlpC